MSGRVAGGESPRVESLDDLVAYFASGEKPRDRWRIGTEHEKLGFLEDTLERVPFDGPRGIEALLERIASTDLGDGGTTWERIRENGRLIALERDGASITLEPGGQLELSGAPLRTLRETCAEFHTHVDMLKRAGAELGIAWMTIGADPFHALGAIPRMPKARYDIMRAYLPTRGSLGLHMMHATATVQANYDYASEADMAEKLRTALGCSPIVSALFANSPLSEGKPNGYATFRVAIWRDTDPDRCGLLPFVFDDAFGYRDYAEWALDVPMFFLVRGGTYHPVGGATFRTLLERGIEVAGRVERATLADWDLHLTTLFPEVRLKRFIEVRGADAGAGPFTCALPAIWKGVLYDPESLRDAWSLVSGFALEQRERALVDVSREGLRARIGGTPALELARALVDIAEAGLDRIARRGETDGDERHFLEPLRAAIAAGKSPAHELLDVWRSVGEQPARLLERARY